MELDIHKAVSLARQTKELSLNLYKGQKRHVRNTTIFYRTGKPIRMVTETDRVYSVGKMVDVWLAGKIAYSADHIMFMSDGGLISKNHIPSHDFHRLTEEMWRRKDPKVAISIMVVEATRSHQNVVFLPYRLSENKSVNRGYLDWLDTREFQTDEITSVVKELFADVMKQPNLNDYLINNAKLQLSKQDLLTILEQSGDDRLKRDHEHLIITALS